MLFLHLSVSVLTLILVYFSPLPGPAFGSKLTFKNVGYGGGLLHSHVQTYPVGSNQQQVTCYHYKDDNNNWVLTPTWEDGDVDPTGDIRFLKDNDVLRLVHHSTGRNLHSHAIAAPVSKLNNEISCYGNATIGDSNDYWIVEVVSDLHQGRKDKVKEIHSLTTRLRFKHQNSGCYMRAANTVLPQWGFKQIEVSCEKENNPSDPHTHWNIESHWNERRPCSLPPFLWSVAPPLLIRSPPSCSVPAGSSKLYKSPFFSDFWHLNIAMWTSNNALVPDPDKEDILASQPWGPSRPFSSLPHVNI